MSEFHSEEDRFLFLARGKKFEWAGRYKEAAINYEKAAEWSLEIEDMTTWVEAIVGEYGSEMRLNADEKINATKTKIEDLKRVLKSKEASKLRKDFESDMRTKGRKFDWKARSTHSQDDKMLLLAPFLTAQRLSMITRFLSSELFIEGQVDQSRSIYYLIIELGNYSIGRGVISKFGEVALSCLKIKKEPPRGFLARRLFDDWIQLEFRDLDFHVFEDGTILARGISWPETATDISEAFTAIGRTLYLYYE